MVGQSPVFSRPTLFLVGRSSWNWKTTTANSHSCKNSFLIYVTASLLPIHNIKQLNVSLLHISEAQNSSILSYFQPRLSVEWDAFEDSSSQGKEASLSWNRIPVNGTVTIKNTVEAFKVPLVFLFGCSSFAGVLVLLLFLLLLLLLLLSSSLLLTFPRDDPYNASQAADKAAFIQQEGSRLWEDILQDRWRENPDRLVR